jgi:TnsA endonuclease N terminal/TnsA endonuclease C terminal
MAWNKMILDETTIKKRLKEGRGKGEGTEYKPWLTVRDVSSLGWSSRILGWKTNRLHHALSSHEGDYVYIGEWSKKIVDIREQYPLLPLENTLAIAESCGIEHPVHPKTKKPIVLTTDFLLTLEHDGRRIEQARTIKPFAQLASDRTLEKFEIERLYWKALNIDWGIVTEHEIPKVLADNVERVHDRYRREDLGLTFDDICDIAVVLTDLIKEGSLALRHATRACDRRLGHEPGASLAVAYHLIARRYWIIDMYTRINTGELLILKGENLQELYQEGK